MPPLLAARTATMRMVEDDRCVDVKGQGGLRDEVGDHTEVLRAEVRQFLAAVRD